MLVRCSTSGQGARASGKTCYRQMVPPCALTHRRTVAHHMTQCLVCALECMLRMVYGGGVTDLGGLLGRGLRTGARQSGQAASGWRKAALCWHCFTERSRWISMKPEGSPALCGEEIKLARTSMKLSTPCVSLYTRSIQCGLHIFAPQARRRTGTVGRLGRRARSRMHCQVYVDVRKSSCGGHVRGCLRCCCAPGRLHVRCMCPFSTFTRRTFTAPAKVHLRKELARSGVTGRGTCMGQGKGRVRWWDGLRGPRLR